MPFPGINVRMEDLTDDPRLSWISNTLVRVSTDVVFVAVLGSSDGPARGLVLVNGAPMYCARVDGVKSNSIFVCCPLDDQEYAMIRDYVFWWAKYQGRSILYDAQGRRQNGPPLAEGGANSSYYIDHVVACRYTQTAISALFVALRHRPPTLFFIGWGAALEGEDDD